MNMTAKGLFSGLLYAFGLLAISVVLLSLFLLWTNMKEESLTVYIMLIHIAALLTGGFIAGKRSGAKGWLNGGILGLCYGILILITGFLAFDAGLSGGKAALLVCAFIAGAAGGILGVQFQK